MPTRIDNVAVVVEDMDGAIEFFSELGLELEGRTTVEGDLVDRVIDLDGARSEIAMMRAPDGQGGLELTRFERPELVGPSPRDVPSNVRGVGRVMFEVDDIDDVVARLTARGGALVRDIVNYEDVYRLCYMRGPEGILIGLAQDMRKGR
jgi:catechol 2,3-dioxygenase-like lactoylglutathione lyase family enzyme